MRNAALRAVLLALAVALPWRASAEEGKDPVVAVVNGARIHYSDVQDARQRLPERFKGVPLVAIYPLLVSSLIDTKLVAAEARKQNLQNDKEVKRLMTQIEDQVLERVFMTRRIASLVTEEALRARYEKMVRETPREEQVHARHILVETEAKAKEVIAALKKGGDFAELAKQGSVGPSAKRGGDLGFFSKGDMVPEFADAAFALKAGEFTTTPVQTQFGWHVIKVEERRMSQPPSFEDAREGLAATASGEVVSGYLEKLRAGAAIERFNPDGSPTAQGGETGEKGEKGDKGETGEKKE